jgi:hypothetical protein
VLCSQLCGGFGPGWAKESGYYFCSTESVCMQVSVACSPESNSCLLVQWSSAECHEHVLVLLSTCPV